MATMQEHEGAKDPGEVDSLTNIRLGSEELRASLDAVRSAQSAARARARRETRWARAIATAALMAVGVTAWAAAHRPPKARAAAMSPSAEPASTPVAAPAEAPAPAPAPREAALPAAAAAAAPSADDAVPSGAADLVRSCDAAYEQRNWPAIASTCAAAAAARPRESALAMRAAQAEHRRGHVATAAVWARKALAIDADIPEAFVIVAHADTNAGDARAAADAYRRYLALAPRGWHAPEARRALRAHP